MKFTIKKQNLESIVSNVIPYLEKRDSSAITSHIFISVEEDKIQIKATDQEIGLCYEIKEDIEIKEKGIATANGKNLLDIIKNLKEGQITLSTEADNLHVKQNRSQFKISMLTASDYPNFPTSEGKNKFDIIASVLSSSLKKIEPCIDANNAKYEFTGALLDIKKDKINIVGSDGKRLGVYSLDIGGENEFKIILPKRAITEMQKIFNKEIEIFYDETILLAKGADFTFFTKLINGRYADYEKVINGNFANFITLKRDEFLEGLKIVRIMSDLVKVTFSKDCMKFEVTGQVGENGETSIDTSLELNEEFSIFIKNKNVLDFLSSCEDQTLELGYNDTGMPFILTSGGLRTVITQISK